MSILLPFQKSDLPGIVTLPLTIAVWVALLVFMVLLSIVSGVLFFLGGRAVNDEFFDGVFGNDSRW